MSSEFAYITAVNPKLRCVVVEVDGALLSLVASSCVVVLHGAHILCVATPHPSRRQTMASIYTKWMGAVRQLGLKRTMEAAYAVSRPPHAPSH